MSAGDFAGFHFLPPSIHLPPWLQPVHGGIPANTIGTVSIAGAIPSAGVVLQHAAAADHMLPPVMMQS